MSKITIGLINLTGLIMATVLSLSWPPSVAAQFTPTQQTGLTELGNIAYNNNEPKDIRLAIADVIRVILGLVGFILVILMIIAGVQYMTAAGNKAQIDGAISRIKNAFIGLIIILISYAATVFIIAQLNKALSISPPIT